MGDGLQDEEKALETLMSKRSALHAKRTELERKIKDLGSLPAEAFEKYQDYQLQDLHKLLQKSNTQLKKFRLGSAFGCFVFDSRGTPSFVAYTGV